MSLRLCLALALGFFGAYTNCVNAMVVREAGAELPSSFNNAVTQSKFEFLINPATARLVNSAQIFSPNPNLAASVVHNAMRGITKPTSDLQNPSLQELIVIASVDPSRYVNFEGSATDSTDIDPLVNFRQTPVGPNRTVRDLARALLNRGKPGAHSKSAPDAENNRNYGRGGYDIFSAFLESELDRAFVSTVTKVVTPSTTPDGLVALNFMGIRDFAFLVSPITNKIQVLDFRTGTTLTISHSAYDQSETRRVANNNAPAQTPVRPIQAERRFSLAMLLVKIRAIVLHPLTLLSLALITIFTFVSYASRRTAN